ncbi:cytochrome P450 [Actinomadura pelletieri DSM 43383]|uniref:Cytochrome P450 n=1 Tax=Actinomadura pelletieri DSM 43383 TaxID=1120940 RepID=A0A495QGJ0_9ACTN|nr:cytochrome P450 [Actinomadura pelletieri]RKS70984.1 cytochrome P450 [Actinomadura pelletieri DSM 43383]
MRTDGYLATYDALVRDDPSAAQVRLAGWLRTGWRDLFAELRADRPVLTTPAFSLVTRHADVLDVLSRPDSFPVSAYRPALEAAVGAPHMLSLDGTPMNWREKGLMQVMLAPEDVPAVRALAGEFAEQALDEADGEIDAVHGLFRAVPLRVCARYFGFPGPDEPTLSRWSRAIMTDVTTNFAGEPGVRAASVAAGAEMMAYLRGLVAERRAANGGEGGDGGTDVLGRLVRTRLPAELGFDDERVAVNVAGMLLGFVENAAGSMTNVVSLLLGRPELHAEAAAAAGDPERFDPHVWEALRFDPFLKMIVRYCARDHVLPSGATVPAGRLVMAAVASAMFDDTVVEEPAAFRTDRSEREWLHFGHGPHACLGVHPGRVVLAETVRRVMMRPGLRAEGDVRSDRGVFPDGLVLRFDAPAREGA